MEICKIFQGSLILYKARIASNIDHKLTFYVLFLNLKIKTRGEIFHLFARNIRSGGLDIRTLFYPDKWDFLEYLLFVPRVFYTGFCCQLFPEFQSYFVLPCLALFRSILFKLIRRNWLSVGLRLTVLTSFMWKLFYLSTALQPWLGLRLRPHWATQTSIYLFPVLNFASVILNLSIISILKQTMLSWSEINKYKFKYKYQ